MNMRINMVTSMRTATNMSMRMATNMSIRTATSTNMRTVMIMAIIMPRRAILPRSSTA